jgi:hypothetical protein
VAPDYWRTPQGRALAAAVVGAAVLIPGCGDDDSTNGDAAEPDGATDASAQGGREGGLTSDVSGSNIVQEPARTEPLTDYREFVGQVEGSDLYVGLISLTSEGGDPVAIGYLCDSADSAELLFGTADGELDLSSEAGTTLTGSIEGESASGTLTLEGGEPLNFTAEEVDPEGDSGVFFSNAGIDESFEAEDWGGWIVLPDGSQRGNTRVRGAVRPAPMLSPESLMAVSGGTSILVGQVDQFIMRTFLD